MIGLITKGIGGFYYVYINEQGQSFNICKEAFNKEQIYVCKARGIFKKNGISPMIGDMVKIQLTNNQEGVINEILPRKNQFIRPPIANVDTMVVVVAVTKPKPNLATIDKFLVMAEKSYTKVVICLNKIDLATEKQTKEILDIYGGIYETISLSGINGTGIDKLKPHLKQGKVALVGPSGVGKSTILNKLKPEIGAEIGSISSKTSRGKHTTRHVELFQMPWGAMIYDTPGFTSFDILESKEEELHHYYPEMKPFLGKCKYDNCRHMQEPDCAICQAVSKGIIKQSRYNSYLMQMEEIKKRRTYG